MAASFYDVGSQSTQREPQTMGKQLVNFIICGCELSASFFVLYWSWKTHSLHSIVLEIVQAWFPVCNLNFQFFTTNFISNATFNRYVFIDNL
jgi:hypothetical protein